MPRLLCFGDSNTHGTPPIAVRGPYFRYDAAIRWPTRLADHLGSSWDVAEEGLPGRTAQFADHVMGDHMDGRIGLKIAMQTHGPLDWLAIMLGTNDVKTRFGATPAKIVAGIAGLVDYAMSIDMAARHPGMRILLIAPVPVIETGCLRGEFIGGAAKSAALVPLIAGLARARDCAFLDAGMHAHVSPVDGVHLPPAGHAAIAEAVGRILAH
ncbi:MAG: lipolytic enzyme, G-D-S-L [Paracoccaceae bacterium]|nr:MAG: lipolytic enzyme, G-D-S-L [Paracoccaceae bacterium]